MTETPDTDPLDQAVIIAHVRAWRTSLLALHKVLIDAELARYGAAVGPVEGPHHAMKLLGDDPWFAWLRPILVLIVQVDERLADDEPLTLTEFEEFRRETRGLLTPAPETAERREYQRSLQELPAAVVLHGKLLHLTKDGPVNGR